MQANWFDKIQEWGDTNKIKGTQTHTPNAILPFYSVDIMLQYLSQSYAASTVIGKKNEYVKEKNLMDKKEYQLFGTLSFMLYLSSFLIL